MDILLSIAAFILALVGIVGCIVPILPGIVLTYAGLVCAYFCSYSSIQTSTLWIWLAVTVVLTVLDYVLPGMMTRKLGGSRAGAVGATIGVFAGIIFGGFAGVLIGPFAGAVIGELLHDAKDVGRALRAGFGSFVAFMVGTGLKLIASVWMLVLIASDTFTPVAQWFANLF